MAASHLTSFRQKGLTLLELMIVIAIIGILATLAIPSYQAYTNRAKFVEVMYALTPYKLAVEVCMHEHGTLTACGMPGENGIPTNYQAKDAHTGYIASINVAPQGKLIATSQRIAVGDHTAFTYILIPVVQATGTITWMVDPASTCLAYSICKK